jgi:hypothetical protein
MQGKGVLLLTPTRGRISQEVEGMVVEPIVNNVIRVGVEAGDEGGTGLRVPSTTLTTFLRTRTRGPSSRDPTRVLTTTPAITRDPRAVAVAGAVGALRVFDILKTPSANPTGNPILPWNFPIPAIHLPVGGRLQLFWENWQEMGVEDWVVNVLRKGYTLRFCQRVHLSPVPIVFQEPRDPMVSEIKHSIIMEYLDKQAIEVAPTPLSPGFYSFIFLRQKKSGKWRGIINLKPLNQSVLKYKFCMLFNLI